MDWPVDVDPDLALERARAAEKLAEWRRKQQEILAEHTSAEGIQGHIQALSTSATRGFGTTPVNCDHESGHTRSISAVAIRKQSVAGRPPSVTSSGRLTS